MSWLQTRLNELEYTHLDLQRELANRGIQRVRATITGWTNGRPIKLLSDPIQTKILADVLEWSVLEMLVAAGYDIDVPKELIKFIEAYRNSSKKRRAMFKEQMEFALKFLAAFEEDQLDEPTEDERG